MRLARKLEAVRGAEGRSMTLSRLMNVIRRLLRRKPKRPHVKNAVIFILARRRFDGSLPRQMPQREG